MHLCPKLDIKNANDAMHKDFLCSYLLRHGFQPAFG